MYSPGTETKSRRSLSGRKTAALALHRLRKSLEHTGRTHPNKYSKRTKIHPRTTHPKHAPTSPVLNESWKGSYTPIARRPTPSRVRTDQQPPNLRLILSKLVGLTILPRQPPTFSSLKTSNPQPPTLKPQTSKPQPPKPLPSHASSLPFSSYYPFQLYPHPPTSKKSTI